MDPNEIGQARIQYVRVTNGLGVTFTDRYDGVPVRIPAGKTENLPPDMAAHFFGPNIDDDAATFRHVQKRQGWNTPEFLKADDDGRNLAQRNFDKLKIEAVMYKLVPVDAPDPRQPVPADPEIPSANAAPRRGPGRPRKEQSEAAA
jgi:hypothetical protein